MVNVKHNETVIVCHVNYLTMEQNYEWAEMFDRRLQDWRRTFFIHVNRFKNFLGFT